TVDIYDGEISLGIDLDTTVELDVPGYDELAVLPAFHEGFHFLGGQDDFVTDDTGGRDPVLPLDWQPRFLRAEEIGALRTALAEQGDTGIALGKAAYWHER